MGGEAVRARRPIGRALGGAGGAGGTEQPRRRVGRARQAAGAPSPVGGGRGWPIAAALATAPAAAAPMCLCEERLFTRLLLSRYRQRGAEAALARHGHVDSLRLLLRSRSRLDALLLGAAANRSKKFAHPCTPNGVHERTRILALVPKTPQRLRRYLRVRIIAAAAAHLCTPPHTHLAHAAALCPLQATATSSGCRSTLRLRCRAALRCTRSAATAPSHHLLLRLHAEVGSQETGSCEQASSTCCCGCT